VQVDRLSRFAVTHQQTHAAGLSSNGARRCPRQIPQHLIEVRAIETDLRLATDFDPDDVGGDPFFRRVFVDERGKV
jgi:hypothetical protein